MSSEVGISGFGLTTTPVKLSATWPFVRDFARAMEHKLDVNRHKGDREGWLAESMSDLFNRLQEECEELACAVIDGKPKREVLDEAADIANFCMMIADKYAEERG